MLTFVTLNRFTEEIYGDVANLMISTKDWLASRNMIYVY